MHKQWNLIAKYISQECTEEENRIIEARIQTDQAFANIIKILQASSNLSELPSRPIDVDALWHEIQQRMGTESRGASIRQLVPSKPVAPGRQSRRFYPILKIAAMLILVISLSYLLSKEIKFSSEKSQQSSTYKTVNIKNGERLNISLADGSQVTVDAGSQFRYFTSYQNEKHVYLKGEASFDVVHDSERPFYVHAGNAIVRVVGTRFNVRSWEIHPGVVVTVAEGKVMVSNDNSQQSEPKMLSQGEQSAVTAHGELSQPVKVDVKKYFAWKENEIFFENAKVREVVAQLTRWYDLKYEFEEQQALEQKITVHIRGANINEVNLVISLVTDTEAVRDGKLIRFIQKNVK
ncbi:FecR domain-containing protein [candidate division KSB1 bacterium]|nr:FecR domain-containing protein [candidate division KSB1 bacterium]